MQTPSFVCSGTMAIEFNDKKKKKKKKKQNESWSKSGNLFGIYTDYF